MKEILIGGGIALAVGAALAFLNYLFTRKLVKKGISHLAVISVLRQTLNIAYLVAIYFLSRYLPWPVEAMLVGGAVGVTVPSFILSVKLAGEISKR